MVSVRLGFSLFILLILASCITNTTEQESIVRSVKFKNDYTISNSKVDKQIDKVPKNKIEQITEGSISKLEIIGNDLWIGKLGGEVIRYNLYTGISKKFLNDTYSIKDFSIKDFIKIGDSIVVLQSDRLTFINIKNYNINVYLFPENIFRSTSMILNNDNLLISTLGFGMLTFDIKNKNYSTYNNEVLYISYLFKFENELYIGSMRNGLYIYNLESKEYLSRRDIPLGLFNKNILQINKIDNKFLFGTSENGLYIWDKKDSIEHIYQKESVSSISVLNNAFAVSLINSGVYIDNNSNKSFLSIDNILTTNNITSVLLFENSVIFGNIKKGVVVGDIKY